jgi:hypothetical protein
MAKKPLISFAQLNSGCKNDNHSQTQPQSPEATLFRHKPQIVSIPGISPKERNRYRVTLGDQVLGEKLSINEAVEMAKRGGRDG